MSCRCTNSCNQHIFSLICLLLRHHLVLFHAATQRQLGQSEEVFAVAANSLNSVYKALSARYLELSGVCFRPNSIATC